MPMDAPRLPSWPQVRDAILRIPVVKPDVQTHLTPPVDVTGKPEPAPVAPVQEGRSPFIPYRGGEMHGVGNRPVQHEDAEGYTDGTVPVRYDDSDPGGTVIDVRVIDDAAEQIKAWRAGQIPVPAAGGAPQQLVSRNRSRTKVTVENLSAAGGDAVWIGPDTTLGPLNGYYLGPGGNVDISTTEAVYAISNTTNMVIVSIIQEYTLEA